VRVCVCVDEEGEQSAPECSGGATSPATRRWVIRFGWVCVASLPMFTLGRTGSVAWNHLCMCVCVCMWFCMQAPGEGRAYDQVFSTEPITAMTVPVRACARTS
jgi:hypothetical protein